MNNFEKGNFVSEPPLPECLKMYEISGQDPINEHSFSRYKEDKIKNNEKIVSLAKKENLVKVNPELKNISDMIKFAREDERSSLIKQGLENPNPDVQEASAEMILFAPENERASLVRLGLEHTNPDVQKKAIFMIRRVPEEETFPLIKSGLEHINPEVQKNAVYMISFAPINERATLIMQGLEHTDSGVQKVSAEMFKWASQDVMVSLFKQGLEHTSHTVQKATVIMIQFARKEERVSLIKLGLEHPNADVQKAVVAMIKFAPEKERVSIIRQCLEHPNTDVQKASAGLINLVTGEERESLIKYCLDHPNTDVQRVSLEEIGRFPLDETSVNIILLKINQGLENPNADVQKAVVAMIKFVPENEISSLIRRCLEHPNLDVQRAVAGMIQFAPNDEKEQLFNLVIEKGFGESLIESPLYKNKDITKEKFSKTKFEKTGSGLILLGGELKEKTVIREIIPRAFLAWQQMYESWELWKEAGFDYVPVEPIVSFDLNQNGLVKVYSGVLDLSLSSWSKLTSRFETELLDQKDKIEEVLEKQKIRHGHTHSGNFCLRFFRDENGKPDLNRLPRLYLIDFDQAVSPGK